MDYGKIVGDAFEYAKDGLVKNPGTWVMLLVLILVPLVAFIPVILVTAPSLMAGVMPDIATFISALAVGIVVAVLLSAFYQSYLIKIFRGEQPLPAVSGFGKIFVDGITYMVIEFIYAIPVFIILALTIGATLLSALSGGADLNTLPASFWGSIILGVLIAIVAAFVLVLVFVIGVVRFARTGRMGEAFNFSAIFATIGRIGWGTYILALIIVVVIIVIVQVILGLIPYLGPVIQFIISPFIAVFGSRYICLIYDAGEAADSGAPVQPS